MFGISVFPSFGIDIEENLDYIKRSVLNGAKYLFTSLHIPEADYKSVESEFIKILEVAKRYKIKVVVDTSKEYFNKFDWSRYDSIILRLDFGFSDEEIVEISNKFTIQLNASTIDEKNMNRLITLGIQTENLSISHNYYPRIETGIPLDLLRKRNDYFKSLGLEIMAFVPSGNMRRGPLYEGLPTVEDHREINIIVAAQELLIEGCDVVLVGDSMASRKELDSLSKLQELRILYGNIIVLPVETYPMSEDEKAIFTSVHEERMDASDYVIRSTTSRTLKKQNNLRIPLKNTVERKLGSITIDNSEYGRYEGELQITKRDLKADKRVNVIGRLKDKEHLISKILPGTKYIFYEITT